MLKLKNKKLSETGIWGKWCSYVWFNIYIKNWLKIHIFSNYLNVIYNNKINEISLNMYIKIIY